MHKWLAFGFRVLLGLVILGGSVGVFGMMVSTRPAPEIKPEVFQPMLVTGIRLAPQPVARSWFGYGTVRAMDKSDTPAQVSARVVARPPSTEIGLFVEKGQTLFELDPTDFRLAAESARQSLASLEAQIHGLDVEEGRLTRQLEVAAGETELARRDYERARDAVARGAGSEPELDGFLAAVRRAERVELTLRQQVELIPTRRAELQARAAGQRVALQQAEENLKRATIVAPISGFIQSVEVDEGEWAQAGRVLVRLVSLGRVEIPLRVPVSAGAVIRIGDPVQIRRREEDRAGWQGFVARIAPEADEATRSLTVYVEVEQDPADTGLLRPGQFVAGIVRESEPSPRVIVPRRTVIDGRIHLAEATPNPEAAIWPVARRIAESLARGAARNAHPSLDAPDVVSSLADSMARSATLEVGQASDSLAGEVARPTAAWMGSIGVQMLEDQFIRVLADHITPKVAGWLLQADASTLPASLQEELRQSQRLLAVHAVPVTLLFTLEGAFPALDPDEDQWVVVEAEPGFQLEGAVLLTSNLDQLIDGMLVDVVVGGRQ